MEKGPQTFQWVLRQPKATRCSTRFVCLGKEGSNLVLEKSTLSSSTINNFHQFFHLQYMSLFGKEFAVFLVLHVKLFLFCMSYDALKDQSSTRWKASAPSEPSGARTARPRFLCLPHSLWMQRTGTTRQSKTCHQWHTSTWANTQSS